MTDMHMWYIYIQRVERAVAKLDSRSHRTQMERNPVSWSRSAVRLSILGLGLLVSPPLLAQAPADSSEVASGILFQSHDVLELTIEGPLHRVFRERVEDAGSYEAVLQYHAPDSTDTTFDVELRTRGSFRLRRDNCDFPPLRVNFKRSQVEGTVFAGENKIKLVTHCQDDRDAYEQYLLQEYLIYRTYNLFTDVSFRVRLARITYIDTDGRRDPVTKYAFFLEPKKAMAGRNGWDVLEVPRVLIGQMQQEPLVLLEVFQFMIANTDYDPFSPEPGDNCCHNSVPIGSYLNLVVLPVPYDFDWAGLISAPYARPRSRLQIESVRDRLFRGVCRPREELESVFPLFLEKREAVYELVRTLPGFEAERVQETIEYLDEFYDIITDPERVEHEMIGTCREQL